MFLAELISCYTDGDNSRLDFWLQMTAMAGLAVGLFGFIHKATLRNVSDRLLLQMRKRMISNLAKNSKPVPENLPEGFANLQAVTLLHGEFTVSASAAFGASVIALLASPILAAVTAVYVCLIVTVVFLIARATKESSFQSAVAEQELEDSLDELLDLPEIARLVGSHDLLLARFRKRINAVYGSSGTQVRAGNSQVILTAALRLFGIGLIPFTIWVASLAVKENLENPLTDSSHKTKEIVCIIASMFLLIHEGMKLAPMQ